MDVARLLTLTPTRSRIPSPSPSPNPNPNQARLFLPDKTDISFVSDYKASG